MFLERLFAVCPLSIVEGLRTVALFQPNFASFPVLKSIFILLTCSGQSGLRHNTYASWLIRILPAGLPSEAKVVAVASPSQLMTHIPYSHLDLPATSGE